MSGENTEADSVSDSIDEQIQSDRILVNKLRKSVEDIESLKSAMDYQEPDFDDEIKKAMENSESVINEMITAQKINHDSLTKSINGVIEGQIVLAKSMDTLFQKLLTTKEVVEEKIKDNDNVEKSMNDVEFGEDQKLAKVAQMMGTGESKKIDEKALFKSFSYSQANDLIKHALTNGGHEHLVLIKQAELSALYKSDFGAFFEGQTARVQNLIRKQLL